MEMEELTYKINGCAMTVHNYLGCGFQELIYQRALAVTFDKSGLTYEREREMDIFFQSEYIGKRRADFVVAGKVIVEIKAMLHLEPVHYAQARNYVQIYGYPVGLLINFGAMKLEFKRVYPHSPKS